MHNRKRIGNKHICAFAHIAYLLRLHYVGAVMKNVRHAVRADTRLYCVHKIAVYYRTRQPVYLRGQNNFTALVNQKYVYALVAVTENAFIQPVGVNLYLVHCLGADIVHPLARLILEGARNNDIKNKLYKQYKNKRKQAKIAPHGKVYAAGIFYFFKLLLFFRPQIYTLIRVTLQ